MADGYQYLDSLRNMLHIRRESLKEKVGRGLQDDSYREHVGRIKELADTLEKINAQIKSINGGDDDKDKPSPF